MWLMLTTGALSIVERDPKTTPEGDERTLVVRARRTEWLDSFRDKYCPDLGETLHLDNKDYQYRAYVKPEDLALAVARASLDIHYHNFKAATLEPEHGLKDPGLRHSLHDAYSKCWSALLTAGDGTSAYDWKYTGGGIISGIEACYRWGHWWPVGHKTCKDCGEPNPSYPDAGPEKVFPKRQAKPAAKKRKARKRKAPARQPVSATAVSGGYVSGELSGSDACAGSWTPPVEDTIAMAVPDNGYQETGCCSFCGARVQLDYNGDVVGLHWEGEN